MEAERQKFEAQVTMDDKGRVQEGPEHAVGGVQKFEFGAPGDSLSAVVGGGYISHHNPDFLQRVLGADGTCSRFYFDKKIYIDIGDPESKMSKKKRKFLFQNGFGYLCIPANFEKDEKKLKTLYSAAVNEYYQYERIHPRPAVLQETTIIDEKGQVRRAFITALDVKVGGGMIGSSEQQSKEFQQASKLSSKEVKSLKLQAKLHRHLRRAVQEGIPFRNPFIAKGKRRFPVEYGAAQ